MFLDPEAHLMRGGRRLIYQHPTRADRLIKVIRPDRRRDGWLRGLVRRSGVYQVFRDELSEYLVLRSRDANREPLVAPFHGLVETNLGLGLEVERISGPDGGLAPTLADLIRAGRVTPEMRQGIDRLARRLADLHVVVGDFKAHNLVLLPSGRDFCVVDGLGEKTVLRIAPASRLWWRLRLARARRRLHARIDAGHHRSPRDRNGAGLAQPAKRDSWP